jgi:hypothetical protein
MYLDPELNVTKEVATKAANTCSQTYHLLLHKSSSTSSQVPDLLYHKYWSTSSKVPETLPYVLAIIDS